MRRIDFAQVESTSVKYSGEKWGEAFVRSEEKKFKFTGAGYSTKKVGCSAWSTEQVGHSTKQGVININFNNSAPPPAQMTKEQSDEYIVGVIFAQKFSLKKGLEIFGDKADVAVKKDLHQIHDLYTYDPILKSDLSYKERREALASLLLITDK